MVINKEKIQSLEASMELASTEEVEMIFQLTLNELKRRELKVALDLVDKLFDGDDEL